jgi:hypothetical protein
MYIFPVVLLMLRTALKPAVTRSDRPSTYPGTAVKQAVSARPCLTHCSDESMWLVATGVNDFFVATAYVKIGFIASIVGGMCMSTVLGSPDCGMTLFNLYDLLQQIESSDDDVSRRVAQAACESDTSGSDHAVDDEDVSDSEESMRCEFVDSMAAESRSVQSDECATSADSDPCETD